MRSNYKRLGDYIQLVNIRDVNIQVDKLLGVSIQKKFIPSIANIIGTDMSTYKIIKKSQFAYGPVTSRNGDKISIALLEEYDEAIVSQAYTVFEISDTTQLLPEYLMMWFRRPEFDRYARYKSHGSAREIFDWNEMCETLLPVPSPEKQRQLVNEYHVLVDRTTINNRLIQKLEETAQAVYKEWFVDFEFPDANGKPYKSNGGEMVESEMGMIPKGWRVGKISEIAYIKHGYAFKGEDFTEEETNLILVSPGNFKISGGFNFVKNKYYIGKYPKSYVLAENELIVNMTDLSKNGDTLGNTALIPKISFKTLLHNQRVGKFELSDSDYTFFIYFFTNQKEYKHFILGTATGTTVRHTSPDRIGSFQVVIPNKMVIEKFNKLVTPYIQLINLNPSDQYILNEMKDLLLSKLATI
jgi:type I restriction enzyme, S subunit